MSQDHEPLGGIDENARRRFEQAWLAGTPLTIEEVLPNEEDPRYLETLEELVLIEMEFRWKQRLREGDTPGGEKTLLTLESYLERFPRLNQPEIVQRLEAEQAQLREQLAGTMVTGGELPRPTRPTVHGLPAINGYEVLGELGRGGMGVVYRARHLRLNRMVALKVLQAAGLSRGETLRRFHEEVQTVAQLNHAHIVPIYEVGEQNGLHFFAMEWMPGGTLAQKVAGTPLSAPEAGRIVEVLARAVEAAHARGIIHRDLKPANVMLTVEGVLKVGDFGLAKHLDEDVGHTQTGQVMGTPSYMAPEQASGRTQAIGPATDVYALGAILYELLTGRPPFRAATVLDTLDQVRNQEPVAPSRLQPRLPRDLETICLKALSKEPGQRYPTAQALAEDLTRFLEGRPILARPAGWLERATKWIRRRPALAALLAVSLIALLALVGVAVSLIYTSRLEGALTQAEEARSEAARQEALAQRYLYLARMGLAQRAWDAGETAQVIDLLEETANPSPGQADPRGFEWHYLRRVSRHLRTLRGHQDDIECVAYSPDGSRLVSSSDDGTVRLWNAATGEALLTFPNQGKWAQQVAFDAQGQRVAAALDQTVFVWEAATGKLMTRFDQHRKLIYGLSFSPDGGQILSAAVDGTVRLWDAGTGHEKLNLATGAETVRQVKFLPDGKRFVWVGEVSAGDGKPGSAWIRVRDVATGQEIRSVQVPRAIGLVIRPDGKQMATAGARGVVTLWDIEQGKEEATLTAPGEDIFCLAYHPSGTTLAGAGGTRVIHVWDVTTGKERLPLRGHHTRPRGFLKPTLGLKALAFHPSGRELASGGDDQTLKIWDVTERGALPLPAGLPEKTKYRLFSPDQKWLASGTGDSTVIVWNVARGDIERTIKCSEPVRPWLFNADGRFLALGASDAPFLLRINKCAVWDLETGREVLALKVRDSVIASAFSADGRFLALGGHGTLVGDTSTGKTVHTLAGHDFTVYGLAFSPDGRWLASASEDATIKLWEVAGGEAVATLKGHQWGVNDVAFSPDGRVLASAGGDNTIRLWSVPEGQPLRTLLGLTGHREGVDSVSFSRDGQRILSVGREGLAKVWDRETGLEVLTVPTKTSDILTAWREAQTRREGND